MKKILLIKTSSMGDIIQTLVAVSDAKKNIPDLVIDWVVEENFAEIPLWNSTVRRVVPIAWRRWRKNLYSAKNRAEIKQFKSDLRGEVYDYIIDVQGLMKSAAIALLAHGPSYGYDWNSAREALASLGYAHKYPVPKELQAVTKMRELLAQVFGYAFDHEIYSYGIDNLQLSNTNSSSQEKYWVFAHSTSKSEKCWHEDNWKGLARVVTATGRKVFLPWGNEQEKIRAERIAATILGVYVLPKLSLTAIAGVIKNAEQVIAVDTGLAHLAAALEVATVVLYGPTDPGLVGTVGKKQIHLRNMFQVTPQQVWEKIGQ